MTNQEYEQKRHECWEECAAKVAVETTNLLCKAIAYSTFDRAYALGKQEIKQETDAEETVISGWVARDEVAIRPALYTSKPLRQKKGFKDGYWSYGMQIGLSLDPELFPDLTWGSDPIEVEIIIKRKNSKQE